MRKGEEKIDDGRGGRVKRRRTEKGRKDLRDECLLSPTREGSRLFGLASLESVDGTLDD